MITENNLHVSCGEVLRPSELVESDDCVLRLPVFDENDTRHHPNVQLLAQVWRFFSIDLDKFTLEMCLGNAVEVLIDVEAVFARRAIEMARDARRSFRDSKEFFLVRHLCVSSMPLALEHRPLAGFFLHFLQSLLPHLLKVILVQIVQSLPAVFSFVRVK